MSFVSTGGSYYGALFVQPYNATQGTSLMSCNATASTLNFTASPGSSYIANYTQGTLASTMPALASTARHYSVIISMVLLLLL